MKSHATHREALTAAIDSGFALLPNPENARGLPPFNPDTEPTDYLDP